MQTRVADASVLTSLSHSSARMQAATPVFIVGHPRSGTSLLYRTLQQHSAFRPKELNLQESQVFLHLRTAAFFDSNPPKQLLRFMLKDEDHFQAFLDETRGLRRLSVVSSPVSWLRRGDMPLAVWRAQGLHRVVRSYFWHAWAARGSRRLLEKSPRNVPHVDKLRLVSPDARMLYMCRHPVDVLSSYRKRALNDASARWADVPLSRFTRIYGQAVRGALEQAEKHPESFLLTRYEDFTHDPVAESTRICRFVGEAYEDGALDASVTRRPANSQAVLYGPIQTVTKRWRDYVDRDDARRLESSLREEMARLSYPSYV
ncbi:MAG: sulfotransferase family protein [Actinomycetes bacterium]